DLCEAGPDLLAGDDQIVAVDDCAGRQSGQVGSGPRLGEALTPDDLATEDLREVERLLRFAAARDQGRAAVVEADAQRRRIVRAGPSDLLVPNEWPHQARAAAAVFLRPRDAGVSGLVHPPLPSEIKLAARF